MNPSSTLPLLRRALLATLLAAPAAHAADGIWNGSSDTLWSTPANWDSAIADDTGFTADFNSLDPLADQFVDLDSPRTIGNLIFGDTDAATTPAGWTLTNNATPTNILTLAGTTPTITINALGTGKLALISASIDGTSGLTIAGPGTLRLAAANTYSGGTVIDGGTLQITADNNVGAYPGAPDPANITIRNGGSILLGDNNNTDLDTNRGITLGAGVQNLVKWTRKTTTIRGIISGAGGLNFDDNTAPGVDGGGGGRYQINGANTYHGDTTITFKGTKDPGVVLNNKLALQNSTLDYNNANATGADLIWFNGGVTDYTDGFTLGGLKGDKTLNLSPQGQTAKNLRIGNNGQNTLFSGVIRSSNDANAGISKIGSGTLTLQSNNTYTGPTVVSEGTLKLGATGAITSSSGLTLNQGGVFDTSAKASFFIPTGKTHTFHLDGTGSGSSGRILANGLNIDTATVVIELDTALDDAAYVLADYTTLSGSLDVFASVVWVPSQPAGYTIDYAHAGGTQIAVVSGAPASPFETWAIAKGLDGTAGKENGPNDNPDTDGQTNLREFGFNGDPLDGANNAKIFGLTEDSDFDSPDTAKEMILTIAVRAGTPAFSGSPSPTASKDGITYTVEGSTTLSSFPTVVNVVPTPVTTDLPPAGAGYEYRSFSLAGSNGLPDLGFLHAKVSMP